MKEQSPYDKNISLILNISLEYFYHMGYLFIDKQLLRIIKIENLLK